MADAEQHARRTRLVREAMERDRQRLLVRQPFIGMILLNLDLVPVTGQTRTACTDYKAVYMNCAFYSRLDQDERLFVLAHEAWHCVLLHGFREQTRNAAVFNKACDLEIHFALKSEKMKEPFVLPHNPAWEGLSAEEIYERLGHRPPRKDAVLPGNTGSRETAGSQETATTRKTRRCKGTESAHIKSLDGKGNGFDEHIRPAVSAERMRQIVVQTAQRIERQCGTLPENARMIVERLRRPQLDWRELLRQFVTACYGGQRRWLPPSRRHLGEGLYLPSLRGARLNAVLAVDTSGSTTGDQKDFFSELAGLLESFGNFELTVIQCDSKIQKVETFSATVPWRAWESLGHGGTDFRPPFDHVRRNGARPDVFIYLTDGFGPTPKTAPGFPVLWVLTEDGRQPAAWGTAITLKQEGFGYGE